jgi:hypothetical protein
MKNRKISWIVTKNKKKSHHPRDKITLQWLKNVRMYKYRIIQAQNQVKKKQKRLITDKCALQICPFIFLIKQRIYHKATARKNNYLPYLNRI